MLLQRSLTRRNWEQRPMESTERVSECRESQTVRNASREGWPYHVLCLTAPRCSFLSSSWLGILSFSIKCAQSDARQGRSPAVRALFYIPLL